MIVAGGILAVAGMQIKLSRDADVAKQRTEATRLAQEKVEELRSYTAIDVTAGRKAWAELATGAEAASAPAFSNASFTRSWTVGGAATDPFRPVRVTVAWTDRAGNAQSVIVNSVIAETDPAKFGALGFPLPQNTNLKRPKDRNLNIPVPAVALGGGKSAYQLGSLAVVFSNDSGSVIEKCTGTLNSSTYAAGTAGCSTFPGFIVAGYVSGSLTASGSTPTRPTGINTDAVTGWDSSGGKVISCSYGLAKDQTDGTTVISGFHYYLCVVPVTMTSGVAGTWGGTIRLSGIPTNSTYKVCRFEYNATNVSANERNVQPYATVNMSLDNQNYYIDTANNSTCTVPSGATGVTMRSHQDCRSSASPNSTTCPTSYSGP